MTGTTLAEENLGDIGLLSIYRSATVVVPMPLVVTLLQESIQHSIKHNDADVGSRYPFSRPSHWTLTPHGASSIALNGFTQRRREGPSSLEPNPSDQDQTPTDLGPGTHLFHCSNPEYLHPELLGP